MGMVASWRDYDAMPAGYLEDARAVMAAVDFKEKREARGSRQAGGRGVVPTEANAPKREARSIA